MSGDRVADSVQQLLGRRGGNSPLRQAGQRAVQRRAALLTSVTTVRRTSDAVTPSTRMVQNYLEQQRLVPQSRNGGRTPQARRSSSVTSVGLGVAGRDLIANMVADLPDPDQAETPANSPKRSPKRALRTAVARHCRWSGEMDMAAFIQNAADELAETMRSPKASDRGAAAARVTLAQLKTNVAEMNVCGMGVSDIGKAKESKNPNRRNAIMYITRAKDQVKRGTVVFAARSISKAEQELAPIKQKNLKNHRGDTKSAARTAFLTQAEGNIAVVNAYLDRYCEERGTTRKALLS